MLPVREPVKDWVPASLAVERNCRVKKFGSRPAALCLDTCHALATEPVTYPTQVTEPSFLEAASGLS